MNISRAKVLPTYQNASKIVFFAGPNLLTPDGGEAGWKLGEAVGWTDYFTAQSLRNQCETRVDKSGDTS